MNYTDPSYLLVSASFVCLINLIALSGIGLNYSKSRKPYLGLACIAICIELLRQIPDTFLVYYPQSNTIYLSSFFVQFLASIILLASLLSAESKLKRPYSFLLGTLIIIFFASAAFQLLNGLPQSVQNWYVVSAPAILASMAITWTVYRSTTRYSAGRVFLLLSATSLTLVRSSVPAIESVDLLYLVYYIETLLFPIMLIALNLTEIESIHQKVISLLETQTQSQKDLQFILDNALDIILVVNNVGLLITWNKRAEGMFGYTEEKVKGKRHIDEFFSDNYCHKDIEDSHEFSAVMENVDGASFPVTVRLKTIHQNEASYSIYVINGETTLRQITEQLA